MARGKKAEDAEVVADNGFTDLGPMTAYPFEGEGYAEAELQTEEDLKKKIKGDALVAKAAPVPFNVYREPLDVGIHKVYANAVTPEHKTQASGCFDLEVYLGPEITHVRAFDYGNREYQLKVQRNDTGQYIALPFGNRALLPTGLIFAIPRNFAISIVTRSSVGLKKGLQMSQSLGYIDEDYRDQVFIPVTNTAHSPVRIDHKERVAQAYLHPWFQARFNILDQHPGPVTDRNGGFGSTN